LPHQVFHVIHALLRLACLHGGPLHCPRFGVNADGTKVIHHRPHHAAVHGVSAVLPGIEAIEMVGLLLQPSGLFA
jgi:hypothetical protein